MEIPVLDVNNHPTMNVVNGYVAFGCVVNQQDSQSYLGNSPVT